MWENKLKLNAGKTHILTVGTAERLRILPDIVMWRWRASFWMRGRKSVSCS